MRSWIAALTVSIAPLGACVPWGAAGPGGPVEPLAVVEVASGPEPESAELEVRAPADDEVVLLRPTARVRTAPSGDALESELFAVPGSFRHAMAVKAVRRVGAYWGVSTRALEQSCLGSRGMFRGLALTVWVHERDLADVLVQPLDMRFSGGGEVHLDPGLPVGPDDDGWRDVAVDGFTLTVQVPATAVGKSFRWRATEDAWSGGGGAATHMLLRDAVLGFRGAAFASSVPSFRRNGELVRQIGTRGGARLIQYRAACARFRAYVSSEKLRPVEELFGQGYGSTCGGYAIGRDVRAKAEAKVFWPDGRAAGHVGEHAFPLHVADEAPGAGGSKRRCFELHPTERQSCGSSGKHLPICFDAADVEAIPPR